MRAMVSLLSKRAQSYLGTLVRIQPVPLGDVKKILRDSSYPCFDPWLEFHERYAGYVEPLGLDTAVWGLVHEEARWIGDRRVRVDRDAHEDQWFVACAEVHPSYNYLLDNRGEFLGVLAESFEIKVERNAVEWEFLSQGRGVAVPQSDLGDMSFIKRLREELRPHFVYEASDCYLRYYMSDRYWAIEDPDSDRVVEVWRHT
jgi:hypothetical protein